jgi:hypothetical protein
MDCIVRLPFSSTEFLFYFVMQLELKFQSRTPLPLQRRINPSVRRLNAILKMELSSSAPVESLKGEKRK